MTVGAVFIQRQKSGRNGEQGSATPGVPLLPGPVLAAGRDERLIIPTDRIDEAMSPRGSGSRLIGCVSRPSGRRLYFRNFRRIRICSGAREASCVAVRRGAALVLPMIWDDES